MLTNDMVSFEQLGPGFFSFVGVFIALKGNSILQLFNFTRAGTSAVWRP